MIITKKIFDEICAQVRSRRRTSVEFEGKLVPSSIPFLRHQIQSTSDALDRDTLLRELAGEYILAGFDDEYLLIHRERLAHEPDCASHWINLARALTKGTTADYDEAKQAITKAVFGTAVNA